MEKELLQFRSYFGMNFTRESITIAMSEFGTL